MTTSSPETPVPPATRPCTGPSCTPSTSSADPTPTSACRNPLPCATTTSPASACSIPSEPAPPVPGKTDTLTRASRIHGTITFPNGQGMQGVNVVIHRLQAFWNYPRALGDDLRRLRCRFRRRSSTPLNSRLLASANMGSPTPPWKETTISSALPSMRNRWHNLIISTQPINPLYVGPYAVGPYDTNAVAPSGSVLQQRSYVTQSYGQAASTSPSPTLPPAARPSGTEPSAPPASTLPDGGPGNLCSYGHTAWSTLSIQANRSLTFEVTALDERLLQHLVQEHAGHRSLERRRRDRNPTFPRLHPDCLQLLLHRNDHPHHRRPPSPVSFASPSSISAATAAPTMPTRLASSTPTPSPRHRPRQRRHHHHHRHGLSRRKHRDRQRLAATVSAGPQTPSPRSYPPSTPATPLPPTSPSAISPPEAPPPCPPHSATALLNPSSTSSPHPQASSSPTSPPPSPSPSRQSPPTGHSTRQHRRHSLHHLRTGSLRGLRTLHLHPFHRRLRHRLLRSSPRSHPAPSPLRRQQHRHRHRQLQRLHPRPDHHRHQPQLYLAEGAVLTWTPQVTLADNGASTVSIPVQWTTLSGPLTFNPRPLPLRCTVHCPHHRNRRSPRGNTQATASACAWTTLCAAFTVNGIATHVLAAAAASGAQQSIAPLHPLLSRHPPRHRLRRPSRRRCGRHHPPDRRALVSSLPRPGPLPHRSRLRIPPPAPSSRASMEPSPAPLSNFRLHPGDHPIAAATGTRGFLSFSLQNAIPDWSSARSHLEPFMHLIIRKDK